MWFLSHLQPVTSRLLKALHQAHPKRRTSSLTHGFPMKLIIARGLRSENHSSLNIALKGPGTKRVCNRIRKVCLSISWPRSLTSWGLVIERRMEMELVWKAVARILGCSAMCGVSLWDNSIPTSLRCGLDGELSCRRWSRLDESGDLCRVFSFFVVYSYIKNKGY